MTPAEQRAQRAAFDARRDERVSALLHDTPDGLTLDRVARSLGLTLDMTALSLGRLGRKEQVDGRFERDIERVLWRAETGKPDTERGVDGTIQRVAGIMLPGSPPPFLEDFS
jgi:hypothetical protein